MPFQPRNPRCGGLCSSAQAGKARCPAITGGPGARTLRPTSGRQHEVAVPTRAGFGRPSYPAVLRLAHICPPPDARVLRKASADQRSRGRAIANLGPPRPRDGPTFTSSPAATAVFGHAFRFTVTATGDPAPRIAQTVSVSSVTAAKPTWPAGQAVMPLAPQHPSYRGIDIMIEQEAHYPAAARSRDASATSAAVRSGNAARIASVP